MTAHDHGRVWDLAQFLEFLEFEDSDPDGVGVVLVADAVDPDELLVEGLLDAAFWWTITEAAAEHDWWYGEPGAERFDGVIVDQVADEWAAFVRERVAPPAWRWYVWRDAPDVDEGAQILDRADEGDAGAFRAVVVTFLESPAAAS